MQPRTVGCWTKDSITVGGAYRYGSTAGEPDWVCGRGERCIRGDVAPGQCGWDEGWVHSEPREGLPVSVMICYY